MNLFNVYFLVCDFFCCQLITSLIFLLLFIFISINLIRFQHTAIKPYRNPCARMSKIFQRIINSIVWRLEHFQSDLIHNLIQFVRKFWYWKASILKAFPIECVASETKIKNWHLKAIRILKRMPKMSDAISKCRRFVWDLWVQEAIQSILFEKFAWNNYLCQSSLKRLFGSINNPKIKSINSNNSSFSKSIALIIWHVF